jgi:hypothetical protein
VEDWLFGEDWDWETDGAERTFLREIVEEFSEHFFLSDNNYLPTAGEDYFLGYLDRTDWWTLISQLDEMVDLDVVADLVDDLDEQLSLPGLPTEILEAPLDFLESVLEGNLPPEPSGRRVGSRRLVKIALTMTRLLAEFPVPAQTAVRAWADVHRALRHPTELHDLDGDDLDELLVESDLPPEVTGFSLMLAMTLMRWPERADGMPLPEGFLQPELYDEVLAQWELLPDSPTVTEEGVGEAEALFAQGRLAHMLAELGTVEGLDPDEFDEEDAGLGFSRLSRAILWLHDQCRRCPEREGVACRAATGWPQRPVPLLDVSSEIANSARIEGCVQM